MSRPYSKTDRTIALCFFGGAAMLGGVSGMVDIRDTPISPIIAYPVLALIAALACAFLVTLYKVARGSGLSRFGAVLAVAAFIGIHYAAILSGNA